MNYIIVYLEIEHLLNFLTQEEKGDFLDLLIEYGKNQKPINIENKKLANVFNFMKGRLDSQFEKARLKAETAKKNGMGGGRPKKDSKPNRNPKKPKETQSVNHNSIYKQLADGLHFILEEKMQKAITTNGWENEIRKLIEIDLKIRQNPVEDVKIVIQAIADNYGKDKYFPLIQSASSLREKFIKVENSINRNKSKQGGSSATDQYFNILNDLERGSND